MKYIDNLKVVLVAGVIVAHAGAFYGDGIGALGVETGANPSHASLAVIGLSWALGQMFAMGTLFFIAGWFTPGSLRRKGPASFLRDRTVRLGIPLIASMFVILPGSWFLGVLGTTGDLDVAWSALLRAVAQLDPGVAWFLTELLIFSVLFVVHRRWRPGRVTAAEPPQTRTIMATIVLITMATFAMRLVAPINSYQPVGLHLYLWPQCLTLFWLGTVAAGRGWLRHSWPPKVRRLAAATASLALVLMVSGWLLSGASTDFTAFEGGWHIEAAGTAIIEGMLSVSVTLMLVDWFRRHATRQARLIRMMSHDAYAAFLVQHPVLVASALLLRAVPWHAEIKFAVLAPAAVAGAFAVAHQMRAHVGVIGRFT
jgi:hypothetical protein